MNVVKNPNGPRQRSIRATTYGVIPSGHVDWVAEARRLGFAPGRRNAKGWVSIVCPECARGGRGGACDLDAKAGGWHCFKCGGKGHLGTLVGSGEGLPERASLPEPEPAQVSRLDVGKGLRILRTVQPRFASQLVSWGHGRGWPAELVALLPRLDGLLFVPSDPPHGVPPWVAWGAWPSRSTGKRGRGAGGDAGEDLRGLLSPGRGSLPLWFVLSDGRDRAVSASRRPAERGGGVKARTLPTSVAGELWGAGFGLLGAAVEAAKRGEPIYMGEGAPDWAALGALCLLDGQGAALGARDAGSFVGRARDLRAALERAGVSGARIVICPHRGDDNDLGERRAGEAAAVLARVGSVAVASVPLDLLDASGKGDVSDVLERGGLARLRSYLAAAVCWDAGSLAVDEAHKRLVELVGGCVERGGVHAVAANLGHGKSYAAKVAAVHHAAGGRVVLYAVPTLELARQAAGDLRGMGGVRVELWEGRHDGNCSRSDLSGLMAQLRPGGAGEVCKGCGLYERGPNQCSFMRQEARLALRPGERGLVVVTTHARLVGHDLLDAKGRLVRSTLPFVPSVVVVDEDAAGSVLGSLSVDAAGLASLHDAGALDVDAETRQDLVRLIGSGRSFGLEPWAERLGCIKARDLDAHGREVLAGASSVTGDAQRVQALGARLVPWQVPAALERASTSGWVGAFVHKGRLVVPWDAELPRGSHATIYLDATTDTTAARAVLGPDAGWHNLRCAAPVSVRFVQVAGVSSSKGDLCGGRDDKPRSARALSLWLASRLRLDGPDTLHVTHKACAELLRSVVVGPVIHFEGGEARGSNTYERCTRVVLDEWHVPAVAVEALAARLMARGAAPDEARGSALRRLLLAPVEQAAGRVRPYNGQGREVVFLGQVRGLEVDEQRHAAAGLLDLDEHTAGRVRACLASVLGLDAEQAAAALVPWGEAAALEVVRRVVVARGVWAPALEMPTEPDGDGVGSHVGERCSIYTSQRSPTLLPTSSATGSVGVSLGWLGECVKGLGGWETAARLLGLRSSLLDVGKGAGVVVLSDGPLTRAGVVAALGGRVERVTFDGAPIWLGSGGSPLRRAVAVLVERGEAVTRAAVASVAGVSERSVRTWVAREPELWASVASASVPASTSSPCELVPAELVEVAEFGSSAVAPSLAVEPLPIEVVGGVEGRGTGQDNEPERAQAGDLLGLGGEASGLGSLAVAPPLLGSVRLPALLPVSGAWRLQAMLGEHSEAGRALWGLRWGVPGPWPVGQVVRAVGLCKVLALMREPTPPRLALGAGGRVGRVEGV